MMRSSKIFWFLLVTLSLIAFVGRTSLLMASSSQSHATHFVSDKGPHMLLNETGCYYCHADARVQCADAALFQNIDPEGPPQILSETAVCDSCHGPGGPQAQ
jgi:hypothetical protein